MSLAQPWRTASPSDLGGQAIDPAGDPHLAGGVHLRIDTSPEMGLPVAPFELARLSLGRGRNWPGVRRDITWIDTRGERLVPPFSVAPDHPVRGYLPRAAGATCCWAGIETVDLGRLPLPPAPPVGPISPRSARNTRPVLRPADGGGSARTGGLVARAMAVTESGAAVVALRDARPFELAATPIDWIELEGTGRISGIRWLDVRDVLAEVLRRVRLPQGDPGRIERWRVMSLPVTDGIGYAGAPPTARADADQRVKEAAPLRFGLDDRPEVAGPAASQPATPEDEALRIDDIAPKLGDYLQALVDSPAPATLTDSQGGLTPGGGTIELPVLPSVMQALGDPSMARWAGFAITDTNPPGENPGDLVAYMAVGAWRIPDPIDGGSRVLRFATVLAAVRGHPGRRPAPPGIDPPQSGTFLPVPPPEARRTVALRFRGLVPAAGLAVARRLAGVVTGLNRRAPSGRAIAYLPDVPEDAQSFGEATLVDRSAPADAFVYRAAQRDWFGRWSEWAERDVAAADRPPPPAPVLQAVYAAPAIDDPPQTGALRGTVTVSVPVPPVEAQAPGSRLLDHLELSLDGALRNVDLPDPVDPAVPLITEIPGPPLARGGVRTVTLTGRWADTAGLRSAPSPPKLLELGDPRPAPDVSLPPGLRYTARPDAAGRARIRLDWTAGPAQAAFRVFYSDETRLTGALTSLAEGGGAHAGPAAAALSVLEVASDPAERAAVFEGAAALFGRDLFEQITPEPLTPAGAGAPVELEHSVDGSLRVLSFYRVTSLTRANVESTFAAAPLVPVRVPNTLTPPRPALSLAPRIDPEGGFVAELTVEVPLGNVVAEEVRVRRAVDGPVDMEGMPVAVSGRLSTTAGGRQRAVLEDRGAAPFGTGLRPWRRYAWRAEVRGPAEPGGPSAAWSGPSPPVSHLFVPPVPGPPAITALDAGPGGVVLRFTHPDALAGGLRQGYALEVHRQLPGARVTLFRTVEAGAGPEQGGRDAAGEFRVTDPEDPPAGTAYIVLVRDPLGRVGPASAPAMLAEA